jgi:hypothetical protein
MMKKITLLCMLLAMSFSYAQTLPFDFEGTTHSMTTTDGATITNGAENDVLQIVGATEAWDRAKVTFASPIDLSNNANNTLRFTMQSTTAAAGEVHQHGVSFQGGGDPVELNFITTGQSVTNVELNFASGFTSRNEMHIFTDVGDFGSQSGTGGQSGMGTGSLSGTYLIDNISLGADPVATCADGIQNGSELGIDCGGSCEAVCPSDFPVTPAPAPPARVAGDVLSLVSDAYTPFSITELPTSWSEHGTFNSTFSAGGNNAWEIGPSNNFLGMQLNTAGEDLSDMDFMHIDYYTLDAAEISIKLVGVGAAIEQVVSLGSTVTGSWQSIDIPMSSYTIDKTNIFQVLVDPASANLMYVDNFYFYKTATASISDNELLNVSMYPNPASSTLNITAKSTIKNAAIYNVLGKQLMTLDINKNSEAIDVSKLATGMYLIKYTIDNATGTAKFIKQ